jgi:hypothetical protein
MTRALIAAACATSAALALLPARGGAQERLVGGATWAVAPVYQTWSFGTPLAQDSLAVRGAAQLSVPIAVQVPLGRRWTLDAFGAYARGEARVAGPRGEETTRLLDGPSDLRLRATGQLVGDGVLLTLGVNAPTGTVRLDDTQLDALRVVGAPALGFRTPVLGSGFGATLGVVLARQVGAWAWALGTAYERRSAYTPVEASIAGVRSPTDLTPGGAVHLSLGADGLAGQHRMSFALAGDLYATDRLDLPVADGTRDRQRYRLGPTVTATWQTQFATVGVRDLTLLVVDRYRAPFQDGGGTSVSGSSGNYFDASLSGMVGPAGGRALVLGLDARHHTGLSVDNTLTTAGVAAAGATLGLALPVGRSRLHPYVRGQLGRIDTGAATSSATSLSVGLSVGSR